MKLEIETHPLIGRKVKDYRGDVSEIVGLKIEKGHLTHVIISFGEKVDYGCGREYQATVVLGSDAYGSVHYNELDLLPED